MCDGQCQLEAAPKKDLNTSVVAAMAPAEKLRADTLTYGARADAPHSRIGTAKPHSEDAKGLMHRFMDPRSKASDLDHFVARNSVAR